MRLSIRTNLPSGWKSTAMWRTIDIYSSIFDACNRICSSIDSRFLDSAFLDYNNAGCARISSKYFTFEIIDESLCSRSDAERIFAGAIPVASADRIKVPDWLT